MNSIQMKSAWDLMGKNFFIPNYQRGYRWNKEQVEDLLNDFFEFYSNDEQDFYCLQPLVVKKCTLDEIRKYELKSNEDNNEWYEVIDGQQRLTTIKIMLKYLEREECTVKSQTFKDEYNTNLYELEYQRNSETRQFIDNLNNDNYQNNSPNIDCEYIKDAYKIVSEWIEQRAQGKGKKAVRQCIFDPIVNTNCKKKIKFIYYEIDEKENPIEVFRRLNSGKVPLTDAELTKALFLLNLKDNNIRLEIANEWDKMENVLRKDDFWCFLTTKTDDNKIDYQKNRICLFFEYIFQSKKIEKGDRQYKYFCMFEELIHNLKSNKGEENAYVIWKDYVRKCFNEFNYWYNDNVIYNYVGYMINSKISLVAVKDLWDKSEGREDFIKKIKEKIKVDLKCKYLDDKEMGDENSGYYIQVEYGEAKAEKVLLLLNVQHAISHAGNEEKNSRFDFQSYRKTWNIENIDSKTENTMFSKEDRVNWLENELQVLENKELKEKIEKFIKSVNIENNEEFLQLKDEIEKYYGETDENEEKFKNNICNLALLGESENKSYGNNTFPVKRRKIIEWDKEGRFIPICTRYCFLKYFSNNIGNSLKWTKDDKKEYNKYIYETLQDFMSKGEVIENE